MFWYLDVNIYSKYTFRKLINVWYLWILPCEDYDIEFWVISLDLIYRNSINVLYINHTAAATSSSSTTTTIIIVVCLKN